MKNINFLMPVILLFLIIEAAILVFANQLDAKGISSNVITAGNLVLLALTIITGLIQKKALTNSNPNVFIRSVMSGMLIKLVIGGIIIILYATLSSENFNKSGIFSVMILYLFYLATEVVIVMKLNKKKNG